MKELPTTEEMTPEELAHQTGLHPTYISDIERGARNPSFAVLVRIASGLDVPMAELGAAYDKTGHGGAVGPRTLVRLIDGLGVTPEGLLEGLPGGRTADS